MAKAAILDVLESTIGRYVKNLDAESLNVAVWAGKIQLNSLTLDVDNVNAELSRRAAEAPNLAVPFRVLEGKFQSLRVDVPWARLTSRPVVLRAEGLDVLIEPYDHLALNTIHKDSADGEGQSSGKKNKKTERKDERQQSLEYTEETRQRKIAVQALTGLGEDDAMEEKTGTPRESSSGAGFKAKLVRRIIENLQLQIDGVHLRMWGQGCNAGIVLGHFSVTTTDEEGNQTFVDRASNSKSADIKKSFLYKSLKLKGLGIYCDEDEISSEGLSRMKYRSPSILKKTEVPSMQDRSFILAPLSFQANLRQSDCIQCVDFPKYAISTQLKSVSIVLLRTQLEMINNIVRDILSKRQVLRPLFPEYRPSEHITRGNTKLWWKYAVRCIGRLSRRTSWTEFFLAYRKRKVYVPLYKRFIHHSSCSWLSPLTTAENVTLKTLEADKTISVLGIMNWRNMADAQVAFERRKHEAATAARKSNQPKSSPTKNFTFSSMFGNKTTNQKSQEETSLHENGDEIDEPPITLTLEEMKELEIALDASTEDEELSNDSILCDIKFTLGSFKVDLITFGAQPVASFQMGTLMTSFIANADGSFSSDFTLLSLNIYDRITPKSIFPLVVRSLQASTELQSKFTHAFEFELKKARNGDQELMARMVSFEIVASPILLKELHKFVTFEDYTGFQYKSVLNPTLEETISGGADLFYDAAGVDFAPPPDDVVDHSMFNTAESKRVRSNISSKFADAWGDKVAKKASWKVDIEIHAPILVIPKCCVDRTATTLVIDLGNFRLTFGGIETCTDVQKWFNDQPKAGTMITNFDNCTLKMENLSFMIAKASDKDWINSKFASGSSLVTSEAIIGPITLSLNLGIENEISGNDVARKCIFCVLPTINLDLSYSQIARIMSVVTAWKKVIDSVIGGPGLLISEGDTHSNDRNGDEIRKENIGLSEKDPPCEEERPEAQHDIIDRFHVSISLQRLSVKISNEDGESIEAHLVSAKALCTQRSDASSSIRVLMGWFWILDRLKHELRTKGFPRRQRLIAHSYLPRTAASFAEHDEYDIMEELEVQGIFDSMYSPSGSLADVTITKSSTFQTCSSTPETSVITSQPDITDFINIDAKFSTLFIHWNPYAIRNLLEFKENLSSFITRVVSLPISRTSVTPRNKEQIDIEYCVEKKSLLIINAEMEAFEVCLNSAKDDLPLFEMTMADSKVKLHLSDSGADLLAYICIGDFRLEIPSNNVVLKDYRTLLGLSPNHSSSLLSIEYGNGPIAMQICDLKDVVKEKTDSFMKVGLSPMRLVYVQAQVLTLVEYVTEGVLGTLTERVASSAAQAARELAKAVEGEKIFNVIASGFDLLCPQAAYSANNFLLHSGNLSIRFTAFPRPGHGKAALRLEDVTMECNEGESMIETPIRMVIDVKLAPNDAPTEDEKAMRVDVSISRAAFLLTRQQYYQLLDTLDQNISQVNTFLREGAHIDIEKVGLSNKVVESRSHSGAEEISIQKRIYMNFKFQAVCLELCNEDLYDPIISMAAVETSISLQLIPDEQKTCVQATLLDLVCDDKRLISVLHQFRQIVRQVNVTDTSNNRDVFQLSYVHCILNNSVTTDITIGSPQVVIIPSIISDLAYFFEKDKPVPNQVQTSVIPDSTEEHGDDLGEEGQEEAKKSSVELIKSKTSVINLRTSDCRLVMIDMDCTQTWNSTSLLPSGDMVESFVLKGQAESVMKFVTDAMTGEVLESNFELHGETIEAYTAEGETLESPVQILDPLKFSAFFSSKVRGETQVIELSFVTLSDVELTLSMKNIALLMAIYSSMNEAFVLEPSANNSPGASTIVRKLTDKETAAIEKLGHELENAAGSDLPNISDHESLLSVEGSCESAIDSHSYSHMNHHKKRNISVKITLPHTAVTMINDMQGLDEALFKVVVSGCVSGADFSIEERVSSKPTFTIYFNTSVQSDFFDSLTNTWQPLLHEPWELHAKATRGKSSRFHSSRLATTIDIESHPCNITFSEQFIIGLRGAMSMWSVFSQSEKKANLLIAELDQDLKTSVMPSANFLKRSAIRAARGLIRTLPYGIENQCGLTVSYVVEGQREVVGTGSTEYFGFDLPQGNGVGGSRAYGQDCKQCKSVQIYVEEYEINIQNLDEELNKEKCHSLGNGLHIFSHVTKISKATIIHLNSFITLHNETSLDFNVSFKVNDNVNHIGYCRRRAYEKRMSNQFLRKSKPAPVYGIPLPSLESAYHNDTTKKLKLQESASLIISPLISLNLVGDISLPSFDGVTKDNESSEIFDLSCSCLHRQDSPSDYKPASKMVLQVSRKIRFIQGVHPLVEIFLQPRTILCNNTFINIEVRTCMPYTFSQSTRQEYVQSKKNTIHRLEPFATIELCAPGSSAAISIKCADRPVGGTWTSWNTNGWIDIPLGYTRSLQENINGIFPFVDRSGTQIGVGGSEFSITENTETLGPNDNSNKSVLPHRLYGEVKNISFSFHNIGVDHTGDILFLNWNQAQQTINKKMTRGQLMKQSTILSCHPLSAFSSSIHNRRITLLPQSSIRICLLQLTIDVIGGMRHSLPFCIEDISLCEGGLESTAIKWEGTDQSHLYAYRRLSSVNQSEIHIIPEFVVFNGGNKPVRIIQPKGNQFVLGAGKMKSIHRMEKQAGLIMILDFFELDCSTAPIRVDTLGMKVSVVKSSGFPVGSIAIQTILGSKDSRFVVKLGMFDHGKKSEQINSSIFEDDFIRFRVRWTQLEISLHDTHKWRLDSLGNKKILIPYPKVAHMLFDRFTVDFQRLYKDEGKSKTRDTVKNTSRSQFAVLIHNIKLTDCKSVKENIVLQSSAIETDLIDFCIRTRGSTESGLICVDLLDLKIAHKGNAAEEVHVKTNEAFLWSLLDIAQRTQLATADVSVYDMEIEWDESNQGFTAKAVDLPQGEGVDFVDDEEYCPPIKDKLYAVRIARVSPISLRVSFKRDTTLAPYKRIQDVNGAALMNYFTKKLKFTVNGAKLNFASYTVNNVNGPSDRILEVFKAHYVSKIKGKLLILISAASLDDWKLLADREDGNDHYVGGDVMRVTGNIAGKSAGFILNNVGKGVSKGLSAGTSHIGDGIQSATEVIGIGQVGAGVNNLVSGLGGGVGDTVEGVGKGGSQIVKGAGKGVGQIIGGVGGGIVMAAQGIGKGVVKGDGRAIATGLGDGVVSVSSGIVGGTGTVVKGTAQGVFSVGKGLFSGLQTIGKGVENAVTGKKKSEGEKRRRRSGEM